MYIIVNKKTFDCHGELFDSAQDALETLVQTYGLGSGYVIARIMHMYLNIENDVADVEV